MRPLHQIIVMFVATQLLALSVGMILVENAGFLGFMSVAPAGPGEEINVAYFMAAIVTMAIVLLVVLTLPIRDLLIKILEFLATVVAASVVFFVILFMFSVPYSDVIGLVLGLLLYISRLVFPQVRNILAMVAAAGVGALIGFSIDPFPMVLLIVAISVYDIIAVWWTKHMVEFARYFSRVPTTFVITAAELKEVRVRRKGRLVTETKPSIMQLGTGDLSIPATLAVSVYKLGSLFFSAAALAGAVLGLYLILRRAEREKRVFPAMPSIAICSLFAFFVAVFIYYVVGLL